MGIDLSASHPLFKKHIISQEPSEIPKKNILLAEEKLTGCEPRPYRCESNKYASTRINIQSSKTKT